MSCCEVYVVISHLRVAICVTGFVDSRYTVVGGDNTKIEYVMTILSPCKPITVRHQWNRVVHSDRKLSLLYILCHRLGVKPHGFVARHGRIIQNYISPNELICQSKGITSSHIMLQKLHKLKDTILHH